MKRTTALTALAAAAALLLAGCGDSTGTATPASNTSVAQSGGPAPSTDGGSDTGAAGAETSADAGMPSGEASASDEGSSTDGASESGTAGGDSSGSDEGSNSDESSATETTIGSNGNLDEATTKWFSTFCEGMAPVAGLKDISSKIDTSDMKKTMTALADAMNKMGSAFTTAAADLKGLPAPTFEGGQEFADKIVKTFGELGPKFTKIGEKFATADPTDPSSMSGLSSLSTDLQDAAKPLQDMQNLKIDSATQQAIGEIPACKKLNE